MSYRIEERDFAAFWKVARQVHAKGHLGVQPMRGDVRRMLNGSANPVFNGPDRITYFTVHDRAAPVGRVTAHIHDAANRVEHRCRGYLGFMEVVDDLDAAEALLDAAAQWLQARGCEEMVANVNLTAMQQMGVVTDGFEHAPYVEQAYNTPHLPRLLESLGFERTFPMRTFELDLTSIGPEVRANLLRGAPACDDVHCRPVRRRGLRRSMEACRRVLNGSFSDNPLFVPLSEAQFHEQARDLMWILDPRLSSVWTRKGQPAGAIVCIPDLNPLLRATRSEVRPTTPFHYLRHRWNRRRAIVLFGGVMPEERGHGLAGVMLERTLTALLESGYESLSFTWIGDDNPASLRQMEKLGAQPMHRLHLFRRPL